MKPSFVYGTAIHGFAAALSPHQLEAVRRTAGVTFVEQDATASATPVPAAGTTRAPSNSWAWTASTSATCPLTTTSPSRAAGPG
ncbi:protease inhibitor I9 family protein [Streptomyces sp. NPDC059446]|uniref:protease inhibitor I9 family protein n=1 Tax=Streptomyces sp. NPDC059446 TaxID=3346833 RepID=UPI00369D3C07